MTGSRIWTILLHMRHHANLKHLNTQNINDSRLSSLAGGLVSSISRCGVAMDGMGPFFYWRQFTMDAPQALATHIGNISEEEAQDMIDNHDYLVLTDEEADDRAHDYIKESIWAFNPSFIVENSSNLTFEHEDSIKDIQSRLCESANAIILCLIDDIEDFADSAIGLDGRGHFLSPYDGNEYQVGDYFIYRLN